MNLSKQIKKYREQHQLSQEMLSEKIFVSRQTISNWETGRSYPDVQNLLLLGEVFGVSLDELVKGDVAEMKQEINRSEFKQMTMMMTGLMALLAVVTLSLTYLAGVWAFAVVLPVIIVMLWAAFRVEKLKKTYNLETYKEILAFLENEELPVEARKPARLLSGQKALVVVVFTICFIAVMLLTGSIAIKVMQHFAIYSWWH